jgi:UrcA family protein
MSPMNRKSSTLIGIAVLCAAAFTAAGAIAAAPQDTDTVSSMSVKYLEADLAQPGGAQLLYRRLQGAARRVCHEPDRRQLARYAEFQQCFERAVDDAVAKVNVTALTAYHHRVKIQRTASG